MEQIAKENFELWNKALQTKDSNKVADLYDQEATFLPTMSSDFKIGNNEALDYFKHFLLKNPFGKIIKDKVQAISPECYIHSGMYNFEIDKDNGREKAEARFTFIWAKNKKGEWKILHHHSSLKPI